MTKSLIALSIWITLAPLVPAADESCWTFEEDFERGIAGWHLGDGWSLERRGEGRILIGRGHSWAFPRIDLCYNYSIQLRLRLVRGTIHISFRNLGESRYLLGLNEEMLYLSKQVEDRFSELKIVRPGIGRRRWYRIGVLLQGEHIKIYVDDRLRMSYTDSSGPLLAGRFAFETLDGSEAWIDQVRLVAVKPIQESKWIRTGGPPGGLGYDIRIHPLDKRIMFVTDNPSGVNKSYDGGRTWVTRNDGITSRGGPSSDSYPIFSLTIDPVDPKIVWAGFQGQKGIFKSYDCGESWIEMDEGIEEDGITIRSFAVDPGNHDVVYAGAEIPTGIDGIEFEQVKGKIYKTTDGGKHWFAVWEGGSLIRTIIIDPRDSNVVYAASGIFDREAYNRSGVGVLKSIDGGKTWRRINDGLDNLFVGFLEMHPRNPDVLFAAAGNNALAIEGRMGGVYKTTDGGGYWRKVLEDDIFTVVVVAPSDPDIVYAGSAGAFYRSEDGGETWIRFSKPEGCYGPPGIRAGVPISAVVDPDDPYTVFVNNYGGGCFKSTDGGRTWIDSSRGYTGAEIHAVELDPRNPNVVYAIGRSGPFKSLDGGMNWIGLAYSPASFAEWYDVALNPREPDEVLISDEHTGAILKSRDGGRSWRMVYHERRISGHPRDRHGFKEIKFAPSDPRIVYAGMRQDRNSVNSNRITRSFGLFKSTDGGESWFESNGDLPLRARNINCVAIDPENPNRVFIGTLTMGLFLSNDGGRGWQARNNGLRSLDVRTIAISPVNPRRMFVGLGEGAGLFVSDDGGESWREASKGIEVVCPPYLLPLGGGVQEVSYEKPSIILISSGSYGIPWSVITDVVIDPTDPNRIFISDMATGVYMSLDGGTRWRVMNEGLRIKAVKDLAISSDGRALYAATMGGGVYRLRFE
jgi:photosystem II stability/assembly factor-like uncharacterized protein